MSLKGIIKGLHHVTATVNDAQEDYDFYVKLLGLRLVKETVNFDNEKVYHFYYGNKIGGPSTIFTTFPYKGQGVRDGVIGVGQVTHTAFSVPKESFQFWKNRLTQNNIVFEENQLFNRETLDFKDPSGLLLQIVAFENDDRSPIWTTSEVSEKEAIRGIAYVLLLIPDMETTSDFLNAFGYKKIQEENNIHWFEVGTGGVGNAIMIKQATDQPKGKNGIGTVHHLAHRVNGIAELNQIKQFMEAEKGLKVTEVKDRKYFQSIYFRIPGGVLFEVATTSPGFMVDEKEESLGSELKLPDWQEPHRERISANLLKYTK